MRTLKRLNNWHTLSESEIKAVMPWMVITHRYRMSVAVGLLIMFLFPTLAFPIIHYINNTWDEFLKHGWVYILASLFVFIAVYSIVDYSRKMKKFKSGDFQVVNVVVSEKLVKRSYRAHYNTITVKGLFENDRPVEKQFKVQRLIYKMVSVGDRAYVIKYNGQKTKKELSDLDFLLS